MPQRTKILYTLQRIDTQLTRKRIRYRQVQAHLGEHEELERASAALKAAQKELTHWRSRLRTHELETGSVVEKLRATQERLYGGKVTNPRELGDLQKESEYLKRRQAALEEKQIEEMMTVEQLTTRAAVAKEEFVVIEAAWRQENAQLSTEYDTLRHEMAKLLAQRKTVVKRIGATDLAEYDALRRLRKGIAIVATKDGACQVCNVRVPQRDLEKARDLDQIFYCSGCERILYVTET